MNIIDEFVCKMDRLQANRVTFGMEQNITTYNHILSDGKTYMEITAKWIDAFKKAYGNDALKPNSEK